MVDLRIILTEITKITTEITHLSEFQRQTKCNKTGEDLKKTEQKYCQ